MTNRNPCTFRILLEIIIQSENIQHNNFLKNNEYSKLKTPKMSHTMTRKIVHYIRDVLSIIYDN